LKLIEGISEQIGSFSYIDKDTFSTPFFTEEYCNHFIDKFENLGFDVDENGNYDTLIHLPPGGEEICKDFLKVVEDKIEPEILKCFTHVIKNRLWRGYPVPFIKKFFKTGQKDLNLHSDNSLITLFVKLNNSFDGCETIFPRQDWNMKDLPVGHMAVFPGSITHPHYTTELFSGIKYSLIGRVSILTPRENKFDDLKSI
tara:strand:+ start:38748 stop:39344 length:597 start_codon:yes stop_codon:yes gene_type:complete